ncbi:glycosyltransferase [Alicyclobacillus fodiniaquatilis]|uniref:Glycosyltransferase n=1 Tax=Alicyclobacillus fodiniaquatilis TaxID=1661150 RepID=A0ABW4JLF2_9BACL
MKIAIVHDYLNQLGGAERVVATLHQMFPEAPVYTILVDPDKLWSEMKDANIITSFIQKMGFVQNHFKLFFWLYPFVIRTLPVRGYDLVISSSSAYGKAVSIGPTDDGTKPIHICYCHTPMRFAWNFDEYIENETSKGLLRRLARLLVPFLKMWDVQTAKNVDYFIANSSVVSKRIKNYYNRSSKVIFPPVDIPIKPTFEEPGDYFLVVSRLVSYKRIDLAVRACTEADLPLLVIGDGPDRNRLESVAGPSIRFLGYQSEESKLEYMARCRALIFPGEEDFGITPLEVNGLGRPVVAYRAGGALDTVKHELNGLYFDKQTVEDLVQTLYQASKHKWDSNEIHTWAKNFGREVFESNIKEMLVVGKRR